MSYFVFDMDQTIAELQSVYYFIAALTSRPTVMQYRATYFTDKLEKQLEKAYELFVKSVAKEEHSPHPLGILRPGILHIMEQLYQLKKMGKVLTVVIYSNNSHLESLYFIRDVIHAHLGTKRLITECIHWFHPRRNADKIMYKNTNGSMSKSWESLKDIMVNGPIKAPDLIEPMDIHFFDDLNHEALSKPLKHHYHKVPPYEFKASFDRISVLFLQALKEAHVDVDGYSFMLYDTYADDASVKHVDTENLSIMEDVLDIFEYNTGKTAAILDLAPPSDKGIEIMHEVVENVKRGATRERLKRKRNHTYKRRRLTVRR
jgi:hypothetical protein